MNIVNWDLLRQPINWLVVFAMLAVAGVLITLLNSASE